MKIFPKSASEIRTQDPLSEITRKERRNLLLVSSIGILMIKAEIVPTKISALGVELSLSNQSAFLYFIALLVIYFSIAFVLYAISDFVAWRIQFHKTILSILTERTEEDVANEKMNYSKVVDKLVFWTNVSKPASLFRAILEFAFPIMYGVVALSLLIFH